MSQTRKKHFEIIGLLGFVIYFKVERNLNARIKGKVLVAQTLKQNIIKSRPTKTICQYDEFGFNCTENRILKQTLVFVQKYLALFPDYSKLVSPVINYCYPAFITPTTPSCSCWASSDSCNSVSSRCSGHSGAGPRPCGGIASRFE